MSCSGLAYRKRWLVTSRLARSVFQLFANLASWSSIAILAVLPQRQVRALPPLQYEACASEHGARDFFNLEAHLIAASLKQHPQNTSAESPHLEFRAAFFFLHSSTPMQNLILVDRWRSDFDSVFGLSEDRYGEMSRRYFICASNRVGDIVKLVSCELNALGVHIHVEGSFVESSGTQPVLVVTCAFPFAALRAMHKRGAAALTMRVIFGSPCGSARACAADVEGVELAGSFAISMCKVRHGSRRITACTQPLYGYRAMARAHSSFLIDWLDYHRHIGIEHFHIYDTDGSFAQGIQPFVDQGYVTYYPHWADKLGGAIGNMTRDARAPLCAEALAYTHCLVLNHAVSDWVILLHSPDEYLHLASPLADVLSRAHRSLVDADGFQLHHAVFSQRDECSPGRGSIIKCSTMRAMGIDDSRGSPLLNPMYCVSARAHECSGSVSRQFRRVKDGVAPDIMRVNHYVEFMPEHRGRCERLAGSVCNIRDDALLWGAQYLAELH